MNILLTYGWMYQAIKILRIVNIIMIIRNQTEKELIILQTEDLEKDQGNATDIVGTGVALVHILSVRFICKAASTGVLHIRRDQQGI